ncbi:MAG TPA: HAD family hydrolase [Acidimicrobiia bacterium]|nr:HAD family hydrolase [Acidimicrobiia bacterium]
MIELVVTDLDGTLWAYGSLGVPHPRTLAAWRELERRGVPVLVATGRRLTTTREPLATHNLAPAAVVLNGALAVDLASGERFHRFTFDVDTAARVLDAFRAGDLEPCVYVEHDDYDVYIGARPSTSAEHLRALGTRAVEADLDAVVASVPVLSFGVFGKHEEEIARVLAGLARVADPRVTHGDFGGHGVTVGPVGLSKWTGVLAYCERHGIDADRVLAIGDGANDRELLTHAAIALVPEDAHEDALGVAHQVVPSPAVGGWAAVLDHV